MNLRIHTVRKNDDKVKSEALHILSVNKMTKEFTQLKVKFQSCKNRSEILQAIEAAGIFVYDKVN